MTYESYCCKCHRKTSNKDAKVTMTANGRSIMKSHCAICKGKKCQFMIGHKSKIVKGNGIIGDIFNTIF